jgi:hypothetical protein
MSDSGSGSAHRRDTLLLRLLKTPPQTRDQLKAERAKGKAQQSRKTRGAIKRTAAT